MKTTIISLFLPVMLTGIFLLPVRCQAMQEKEIRITKEHPVSPSTRIIFINREGSVEVKTWDKPSVKVETILSIDGKEDAVAKVITVISGIDFSRINDQVSFNTNYYKSYTDFFPGSSKIILLDGTTAKGITKLKCTYILTIPAENPLTIRNKYANLSLPDLAGEVTLELYESDLQAEKFTQAASISLKYGKAVIASTRDLSLTLYESTATIGQTANLTVTSKYSILILKQSGEVNLDSYEDNIEIFRHGNLNGRAKYTRLTLSDFDSGNLNLYETKVKAGNTGSLMITGKYCTLDWQSVQSLTLIESYENKVTCGTIGTLKATSKYGVYSIGKLTKTLEFSSSYEDNITISIVGNQFEGIQLFSKYSTLSLLFEKETPFKIDADLQYTDLVLPAGQLQELRYHKDGSTFQYSGVVKGVNAETCPVVHLRMYEGRAVLK